MSNDTTATLLKFVTSLTSPKAAIKYIAVGFFLLFSLRFITAQVEQLSISSDYTLPITLFLGIGAGSLAGELIYVAGSFLWGVIINKRLAMKAAEEKAAAEEAEILKKRDEEAQFLTNFIKAYAHFYLSDKNVLRKLTAGEACLNRDGHNLYELERAKYIYQVVKVSGDNYVYRINPTILDYVVSEWEAEVARNTDDFFSELTPEKNELLKIMSADFPDSDFRLESNLQPGRHPLKVCFEGTYSIGEGFWIEFKEKYAAAFAARTGTLYKDKIFVSYLSE